MKPQIILIMAGGTAGHIIPGLTVAKLLRSRGWHVIWLGTPNNIEYQLIPTQDIEFIPLSLQGVRGKGLVTWVKFPFLLAQSLARIWMRLSSIQPHVVLGMGGYITFPGGMFAALKGIPMIIHEQNAIAGTANRYLAKFACRVLSNFAGVLPKAEVTGNPVRVELCQLPSPLLRYSTRSGPLRLLVLGGSQGSKAINSILPYAIQLLSANKRPFVRHQSGPKNLQMLSETYEKLSIKADCYDFIENISEVFSDTDLVICRSGAMTVSEICTVGVAALFIPLPHSTDGHQMANARHLSKFRAAWLQPQEVFTPAWLAQWIIQRNRVELQEVAARSREFAIPQAALRIADICEQTAHLSK